MTALARRAELAKLAHLIGGPVELPLEASELRELRERLSAKLFDDARPVLQRVATGSRLLPAALVARVGEGVFGATLCAQVAGLLSTAYALDLALRMTDPFLASVSAAIDPRSAGEVVRRFPADRIVAVAHQLLARGEYVTLARFVDYLAPETIGAVIDSVTDELELLRIGAYVESPAKLAELVGQLAPDRMRAMIAALHGANGDRWLEALTIAEILDDAWRRTLGDLAAELGDDVLAALLEAVRRFELWTALVPFVLAMSAPAQGRIARLVLAQHAEIEASVCAAARACDREAAWIALCAGR